MSLLFGGERRSISYQDFWGTGGDIDTLGNSDEGALRLVPFYAAVDLIANQFASSPLRAYRERPDGSRERLSAQPPIVTNPCAYGTAFEWKFRLIVSLLIHGNAYGLVTSVDGLGRPSSIDWLKPTQVGVDESGSLPRYYWQNRDVPRDLMFHIPAFTMPGKYKGLSPLKLFMTTFEAGHAAQVMSRDTYQNGSVPTGKLRNTEKTVDKKAAAEAKERFKAAVQGRDLFVTGKDWDYEAISLPPDQARFIEQQKLTATQIANIFHLPPERIGGETGNSLTYGNREQDTQDLVTFALLSWFTRVEEAMFPLLPRPQYFKFNVDSMVRADLKTRMEAHEIALRSGIETNDEARRLEDRPPLTDDEKAEWIATWKKPTDPPKEARSL
jgi:HK97 family phage portal protein